MAADQFTQIANRLFRDPRLSPKAMGVFGHISTHAPGFTVTPASIAQHMRAGEGAVKSALRELEACGYLVRVRERNADGTLGPMRYWITDMPEDDGHQAPSGAGTDDYGDTAAGASFPSAQPPDENPPVDKPPADNPPLKNTKERTPSIEPPLPPSSERSATRPDRDTGGGHEHTHHHGRPCSSPVDISPPRHDPTVNRGHLAAAADLLGDLPQPWKPGRAFIRRYAHLAAAALEDGWDADALAARLTASLGDGNPIRDHMAMLAHRLRSLPAPTPDGHDPDASPVAAPTPPKCNNCDEYREIEVHTPDGNRFDPCPTCNPIAWQRGRQHAA